MTTFPRQVTSILAFGVAKTNKGYCSNKRRKDTFIGFAECANSRKADLDKAMHNYIDAIQGIENAENKLKIPLMCCHFLKLKTNLLDMARETPKCTEQNVSEIERLIDG